MARFVLQAGTLGELKEAEHNRADRNQNPNFLGNTLSRRPTLHIPEDLDQLHHIPFCEHTGNAERIEIGEG